MELHDFQGPFEELCAAFDKSPKGREAMAAAYYSAFQELTAPEWRELCRAASRRMDRFPSINALMQAGQAMGISSPAGGGPVVRPDPFISVECICGNGFVVPASAKASTRWMCGECRRIYPMACLHTAAGATGVARYGEYRDC